MQLGSFCSTLPSLSPSVPLYFSARLIRSCTQPLVISPMTSQHVSDLCRQEAGRTRWGPLHCLVSKIYTHIPGHAKIRASQISSVGLGTTQFLMQRLPFSILSFNTPPPFPCLYPASRTSSVDSGPGSEELEHDTRHAAS